MEFLALLAILLIIAAGIDLRSRRLRRRTGVDGAKARAARLRDSARAGEINLSHPPPDVPGGFWSW